MYVTNGPSVPSTPVPASVTVHVTHVADSRRSIHARTGNPKRRTGKSFIRKQFPSSRRFSLLWKWRWYSMYFSVIIEQFKEISKTSGNSNPIAQLLSLWFLDFRSHDLWHKSPIRVFPFTPERGTQNGKRGSHLSGNSSQIQGDFHLHENLMKMALIFDIRFRHN